jgi:hypothetical protein
VNGFLARPAASNRISLAIAASATNEEVAAIVAALERFARSGRAAARGAPHEEWRRAALLEAVEREPLLDAGDPWMPTSG